MTIEKICAAAALVLGTALTLTIVSRGTADGEAMIGILGAGLLAVWGGWRLSGWNPFAADEPPRRERPVRRGH